VYGKNKDTGESGTLFGDFSLLNIQSELARVVGDSIPQLSEGLRTLSQLGIRSDISGKLTINDAELERALNTKISEVKSVFSAMGTATDPGVVFVSSTADTKASTNGYSVEISRIATKSRVTAGIAQATGAAGQLAQNETLTINGINIDLQAGWTSDQVLTAINTRSKKCGVAATRTDINGQGTGDYLTLTAVDHGSLGRISVKSSISNTSGVNTGFGNVEVTPVGYGGESGAGTGKVGYDVAGKIDGKTAIGSGQSLSVTEGDAKGLTIIVTGGTIGSRGVVKFSRGIGSLVAGYVNSITDKYGALTTAQDSINKQIDGIKQDITDLDDRLKREETLLYVKFSAMETALAKLQRQSSALASLPSSGMLSKSK
jgi:flagellar hook-associated protein 2